MNFIYATVGVIIGFLIFAGLQRRFSPETLINGFMSKDKAKDICPSVFKKENTSEEK